MLYIIAILGVALGIYTVIGSIKGLIKVKELENKIR